MINVQGSSIHPTFSTDIVNEMIKVHKTLYALNGKISLESSFCQDDQDHKLAGRMPDAHR